MSEKNPPSPADAKEPTYEVGYKKPPRHTRFKKGQSGCPPEYWDRRRRERRSLSSLLEQELKQKIVVTENGERKTISKRQAIAKQVVNKAVSGDPKAIPILLQHDRAEREAQVISPSASELAMTDTDEAVLLSLVHRVRTAEPLPSAAGGQSDSSEKTQENGGECQQDTPEETP